MDQQAQASEARLPFEPGHHVVRQLHPLEGRAEHELARMEDERLVTADLHQLGQLGLLGPHVNIRVAAVAEDAEAPIQVQVHA